MCLAIPARIVAIEEGRHSICTDIDPAFLKYLEAQLKQLDANTPEYGLLDSLPAVVQALGPAMTPPGVTSRAPGRP